MKLTISAATLLAAMTNAAKALPEKTIEPILETFLFDASERLSITASNMKMTFIVNVGDVTIYETGKACIDAKHLIDLIKHLPNIPITITTEDNSAKVTFNGGDYQLPCYSAVDYPVMRRASEKAAKLTMPAATLAKGIDSVQHIAFTGNMRPIMRSVYIDITTDSAAFVASDLQTLAYYKSSDFTASKPTSIILNLRHAAAIRTACGKETATIYHEDGVVEFRFDNVIVICSPVVGNYPNYQSVIPKNSTKALIVDKTALIAALKRLMNCSPKSTSLVRLSITEGKLEISAQDISFALSGKEEIPCAYGDDDLVIGFRADNLLNLLSKVDDDKITMQFSDPSHAAVVFPGTERENWLGIIMPILVR